jgi:protein phosphatase
MRYAAGNAQHIGTRQEQQDAFGFSDPGDKSFVEHGGFLGVVADGMGGLTHGSEASYAAVRSFLQAYRLKTATESIADALMRSLREANRAVLQVAGSDEGGVGTTLAAAVVRNHSVHWIAAGDSRIYWLHGVNLTRLNAEHVYAVKLNRQAAEGKLLPSEAKADSERASLTSYLGQTEPELVDHNRRPLNVDPDDCVILCSDGLYRSVGEGEMVSAFHHDLQRGCDFLVHRVLSKHREKQDNLTIIALKGGTSSRSAKRHPARTVLLALMALLLVSLSGNAAYWYLRRPATVEQKPAVGKPSAPDQPRDVTAQPSPAEPGTTDTGTKQPPPQPDTKAVKPSGTQKKQPPPGKKGSSSGKSKPEHGTPDQRGADETPKATPPQETLSQPASPQTPEQGGAAVTPPPTTDPSADVGKEPSSGRSPGNEKEKKQESPASNPPAKPNSTNPPPTNANPPGPNSNPPQRPNASSLSPNPPNVAAATIDPPRLVDDHSSSLRNADLPDETKGPESVCRS